MNRLKKYTIVGIIFVLITGTLSHFVYDWSGKNMLLGFFFPINESIWEHQKLVFFPMLIYTFFISKKMKPTTPCITSSFLLGTLVGTLLVPILFYTYSGILGYNLLVLDLLTFALSVLGGFIVSYKTTQSCQFASYEKLLKTAVFLLTITFFAFTYFPPGIAFFKNPLQTSYIMHH